MKFLDIYIKNFCSFKEAHFPIGNYSGCTLIEGLNLDNPGALSNGAGKTGCIEALIWGLYGKTYKGISGDDVVNDSVGKDCCVEIVFRDDNDREYIVRRYRKDSKFLNQLKMISDGEELIGHNKDIQAKINKVLGLDYNTFISSICIPQEFTALPDKTNTERIDLIFNIMKMTVFDQAKEYTKERAATYNDKNTLLSMELERYKATLQEILSTDYEKEQKIFERTRDENISNLVIEQGNIEDRIKSIRKEVHNRKKKIEKEINRIDNELNDIPSNRIAEFDCVENQLNELAAEERKVDDEFVRTKTNMDIIKESMNEINSLGDNCPTCKQSIPAKHKKDIHRELQEKLAKLKDELAIITKNKNNIELKKQQLKEQRLKLKMLDEQYTRLKQQKEQLEFKLKECDNTPEIYQLAAKLEDIEKRITEEKEKVNPFTGKIEEQKKRIEAINKSINNINEEIKQNNKTINLLTQLVTIFGNKGIKCALLENIIQLFEDRTNYYLSQLSPGTISIEYNTTKALRSGAMVSAFDIVIKEDGVRKIYEKYSGGEKQRIRIAITLALSDLVLSRFDKIYDLVIFDECDQNLDDLGIEKMFEAFSRLDRNVFLITQKTDLKNKFKQVILIKKENGESKLYL
jgi:DNA repair exonuclease SbcCD ATPase subunit